MIPYAHCQSPHSDAARHLAAITPQLPGIGFLCQNACLQVQTEKKRSLKLEIGQPNRRTFVSESGGYTKESERPIGRIIKRVNHEAGQTND